MATTNYCVLSLLFLLFVVCQVALGDDGGSGGGGSGGSKSTFASKDGMDALTKAIKSILGLLGGLLKNILSISRVNAKAPFNPSLATLNMCGVKKDTHPFLRPHPPSDEKLKRLVQKYYGLAKVGESCQKYYSSANTEDSCPDTEHNQEEESLRWF